jgi:prepilin-type N-terminal cleavage/methylation domain-containing protein
MNTFFNKKSHWKHSGKLGSQHNTDATPLFASGVEASIKRPPLKFAPEDEEPGVSGAQPRSVLKVLDEASTDATPLFASGVEFQRRSGGFTLFEVLIALAVFAFSVAGLVMSLDSIVKAVLETREHAFSRLGLESRLAYNLADPPISGDRTITENGITFTEGLTPVEIADANGRAIPNIYRLKITSQYEKTSDSAETLLYLPSPDISY